MIVARVKETFKELQEAVNVDSYSASLPMAKRTDSTTTPGNDQLDLCNPYSLITCFLLYLYSMEFGDPPLYAEMNRVTRMMDTSQLRALGPLAQAFSCIINSASHYFEEDDQGKTGFSLHYMHGGVEENIGGIYMLHNGSALEEEHQETLIALPPSSYLTVDTNTTFSHNLSTALTFAFGTVARGQQGAEIVGAGPLKPTLFSLAIKNYSSPDGILLRNSAYTPYPEEAEMLLKGGVEVLVLGVDPKVSVGGAVQAGGHHAGEICVVYLYLNE